MDDTLKSLLCIMMGAALALFTQYIIEERKRKNDQIKFSFEKIICVGEDFYKFSGLSLMTFETTLNKFKNIYEHSDEEVKQIYLNAEISGLEQIKRVQDATVTLTCADIYYKVSSMEKASIMLTEYVNSLAKLIQLKNSNLSDKADAFNYQLNLVKENLETFISTIKSDRELIALKIKEMIKLK